MKTSYYVRWWETPNDYLVWTSNEQEFFDNKKSLEKFIKNNLVGKDMSNPVFAYEIGHCDKEGDDYVNMEPYEFYNAGNIKKTVEFVVAHKLDGISDLIEIETEITQYEIDTRNFKEVIAAAKEAGHVFDESKAVVFQKEELATKFKKNQISVKFSD